MAGYAAKTSRLDDVEETLPSFDPMVDAAEKQNIARAVLEVSGYWFNPGKDTVEMHFISQGGSEIRSVHFGKVKEGEGSNRGSGYQLWVSLDSEPVCALAVGFHYSNITTSTLSPHWLVSEGCGVWRSPDHCVALDHVSGGRHVQAIRERARSETGTGAKDLVVQESTF